MPNSAKSNVIPIAFAFDDNLVLAAQVAFNSLLKVAKSKYKFFVLFSPENLSSQSIQKLRLSVEFYKNGSIEFIDVGDFFINGYEVRGITIATYYRLLLPEILSQYDKVIYSDVDTLFLKDLAEIYHSAMGNNLIAATRGVVQNTDLNYLKQIDIKPGLYVNAGFLVMNLQAMRNDNLRNVFLKLTEKNLLYQDQDILNISCKGRIKYLGPKYNLHAKFDYLSELPYVTRLFENVDILSEISDPVMIHFPGVKPWQNAECYYYDVWWEAYRTSECYEWEFYWKYQSHLIDVCRSYRKGYEKLSMDKWYRFGQKTFREKIRTVLKTLLRVPKV